MDKMPIIVHESAMARYERILKRLIVVIVLLIVLLVGSNVAWIWYESQFEDVVTSVEADSGDGIAIANLSGEVKYNGESESDS